MEYISMEKTLPIRAIGWIPSSSGSQILFNDPYDKETNKDIQDSIDRVYEMLKITGSEETIAQFLKQKDYLRVSSIRSDINSTSLKNHWKDQDTTKIITVVLYDISSVPPQIKSISLFKYPQEESGQCIATVKIPESEIRGLITFELTFMDKNVIDDEKALLDYAYYILSHDMVIDFTEMQRTFGCELLICSPANQMEALEDIARNIKDKIDTLNKKLSDFKVNIPTIKNPKEYNKLVNTYNDLNKTINDSKFLLDSAALFCNKFSEGPGDVLWEAVTLRAAAQKTSEYKDELLLKFEIEMKLQQIVLDQGSFKIANEMKVITAIMAIIAILSLFTAFVTNTKFDISSIFLAIVSSLGMVLIIIIYFDYKKNR